MFCLASVHNVAYDINVNDNDVLTAGSNQMGW